MIRLEKALEIAREGVLVFNIARIVTGTSSGPGLLVKLSSCNDERWDEQLGHLDWNEISSEFL